MKKISLLFIALSFYVSASAQQIWLDGGDDCGAWISIRKSNTAAVAYEHYVLGLMNGLSIGSQMEFWKAKGTKLSREQVFFWMDNYCAKNPLSSPTLGGFELMNEQTSGRFNKRP
jgi:hypothetical protein